MHHAEARDGPRARITCPGGPSSEDSASRDEGRMHRVWPPDTQSVACVTTRGYQVVGTTPEVGASTTPRLATAPGPESHAQVPLQ